MPRPTLTRRIKYVDVAFSANHKLGREARHAEHDLRRLVGHANLLDVLVEELDTGELRENNDGAETEANATKSGSSPNLSDEDVEDDFEGLDSDSDSYSDNSDDEDHTLVRTASGRPVIKIEPKVEVQLADGTGQSLNHSPHGTIRLEEVQVEDPLTKAVNDEKDAGIQVTVTTELLEVLDELEIQPPMPLPTPQIIVEEG